MPRDCPVTFYTRRGVPIPQTMSVLERRLPKPADQSYFLQFAKDVTSQGGEDGILEEIFRLLCVADVAFPKYCIDIGAWDGLHLSNTRRLLNECGWSGLLIEAEQSRFSSLTLLYKDRPDVHCAAHLVDIDGEHSLKELLIRHAVPGNAGFLCIDVDGADYHLWRSIAPQFRPIVVCIEFNPTIPNDVFFVQAPRIEVQQGSSLLAIKELGEELGYVLVVTTTYNAIFVRADVSAALPLDRIPRDLHQMHVPFMATEMFQTYDGELKFVGTKKLLWHKVPLNLQKLQVLSKKERTYPFAPSSVYEQNANTVSALSQEFSRATQCSGEASVAAAVAAMQSLLDLSQLPVLEVLVVEHINRLLCAWTLDVEKRRDGVEERWVTVVEAIAQHAQRCVAQDVSQAQRFFALAASAAESFESLNVAIDGASSHNDRQLISRIQLGIARCQRLQGEWMAARTTLRKVRPEELDRKARDEIEKENKKINYFILHM